MQTIAKACVLLVLAVATNASENVPASLRGARALLENDRLDKDIVQPLTSTAATLREKVLEILPRALEALESKSEAQKQQQMLAISADIRALIGGVVPKVLQARDASSALDMDNRTAETSQATIAQKELLKMQEYWGWAWPIIIEQAQVAFGDDGSKPAVTDKVKQGIQGSLDFLKPVMAYAWAAEKFMMPNVESLLHQTNGTASSLMEKAACASDYAYALGDMTGAFVGLAKARRSCSAGTSDDDIRQCARDDVAALQSVAGTIAEASKGMWECFGISWACSELINSAFMHLTQALATSLSISWDCSPEGAEQCTPSDVFTALGALIESAGAMESAAAGAGEAGSCSLKGSAPSSLVNPMAATPAELVRRPFVMMSFLTIADDALSPEVAENISKIASNLDASMRKMAAVSVSAIENEKTTGLVMAVDKVLDVLGTELPAFLELVNETNALDIDPALDSIYGGMPAIAEQDLLVLLKFVVNHGPAAVRLVTGAAAGLSSDADLLATVNEKLQEAKTFLSKAITHAWAGVKLQLPRVEGLADEVSTEGVTEEERLTWGECASNYATALARLTALYSNLETSGVDCNATDDTLFDSQSCQSDLVQDMSAISLSISEASKMMTTCFHSQWQCTDAISTASNSMLDAVSDAITMKAHCQENDNMDRVICETAVTKLLGSLGAAARATRASTRVCKAPQGSGEAARSHGNLQAVDLLGNFAASATGAGCGAINGVCWVDAQCCSARCQSALKRCRPIR